MTVMRRQVTVEGDGVALPGDLTVPDDPYGLVLFAHGSGSSRHSPRNQAVAASLNAAGFGTLLFDLLTADEERRDALTGELRFDIALLADVRAPVLLIVGGADVQVRELNEALLGDLPDGSDLAVVPGAGHLFQEPGALDQVAALAAGWFTRHVAGTG
jgi:putative phosphoribosyl transferase